ncbi:unnamed protein product [Somion occarium]|uniref:Uncharacterized protein n=1 Tax=Somion occarium TaxID=3059160 RepID=A0ABP1DI39_9APHY
MSATSVDLSGSIHVETKFIPPSQPYLPALVLQVTRLTGSYMVWIGATEESEGNAHIAPMRGFLLRDWACAMPPSQNVAIPPAATSLNRSSSSDVALAMSQRLARRFQKQIFFNREGSCGAPEGYGARAELMVC